MKKLFLIITLIFLIIPTPAASALDLIPPYHWTYHSLEILSQKDLIKEKIIPEKALTQKNRQQI